MQIHQIKIHQVEIPFASNIAHNLKKRTSSSSIVLAVYTKDGRIGYGEGAPRSYVTGKSLKMTIANATKILSACKDELFESVAAIGSYCANLTSFYHFPAISTALEIALLDLLAQSKNCSISHFLSSKSHYKPLYSGVLPFLPIQKMEKWLQLIKSLELKHLKVKVGLADDENRLQRIRQVLGDTVDLRIDANRAWNLQEAISKIKQLEQFGIASVEEPLMEQYIHYLPTLAQQISAPLMLDESIYTLDHAKAYAQLIPAKQLLFNLKISKSGGLLATSALYHFAHKQGIACQLGCNVGETAILSAAGRLFAQTHALTYLEGSYAPFFMEDDISTTAIKFHKKGDAIPLSRPGLGIYIDQKKLDKYSTTTLTAYA